jgi:hypothetical protein
LTTTPTSTPTSTTATTEASTTTVTTNAPTGCGTILSSLQPQDPGQGNFGWNIQVVNYESQTVDWTVTWVLTG